MSSKLNYAQTAYSILFILGYFSSQAALKFTKAKEFAVRLFLLPVAITISAVKRMNLALTQSLPIKVNFKGVQAMAQGVELVVEIIMIAIALYVAAFILPGALTAIATTALTSVNSAVVTLFQVLVPIITIVVLILLLIAVIRRAM